MKTRPIACHPEQRGHCFWTRCCFKVLPSEMLELLQISRINLQLAGLHNTHTLQATFSTRRKMTKPADHRCFLVFITPVHCSASPLHSNSTPLFLNIRLLPLARVRARGRRLRGPMLLLLIMMLSSRLVLCLLLKTCIHASQTPTLTHTRTNQPLKFLPPIRCFPSTCTKSAELKRQKKRSLFGRLRDHL